VVFLIIGKRKTEQGLIGVERLYNVFLISFPKVEGGCKTCINSFSSTFVKNSFGFYDLTGTE
jgi:hypothetical protein